MEKRASNRWRISDAPLRMMQFDDFLINPENSVTLGRNRPFGGFDLPPDSPDWLRHCQGGQVASPPSGRNVALRLASAGSKRVNHEGPVEHLTGTHVYGGILHPHFGHFVAEHIHRLWVLEDAALAECPVIFLGSLPRTDPPEYFKQLLSLLGVRQYRVIYGPARVDRLVIGEQGKQLGLPPSAAYDAYLERRLGHLRPRGKAFRRLAITRAHLPTGRLLGEGWLEAQLERAGYTIFRPEARSLAAQARAYLGAESLIFTEGSAIHLFDILPTTKARIAVINRRQASSIARASLSTKCVELNIFKKCDRCASGAGCAGSERCPFRHRGPAKHINVSRRPRFCRFICLAAP